MSGYYAWQARTKVGTSAHARDDALLSTRIHSAFLTGRGVYGSPRIQATLRHAGHPLLVASVSPVSCRRSSYVRGRPEAAQAPHDRQPAYAPGRAQSVGPLLYRLRRPTANGSPTSPAFRPSTAGSTWPASSTSTRAGPSATPWTAPATSIWWRRRSLWPSSPDDRQAGLIHQSDRGSQYSSTGYRGTLEEQGMRMSMSGKGEPYDNALMDSFFSHAQGRVCSASRFPDARRSAHLRL